MQAEIKGTTMPVLEVTLQPGEQTQTVTVTGELPSIDTTDATLGGTVSNQAINALPLNGRNFLRLLTLRPGVLRAGASMFGLRANGLRSGTSQLRLERKRRGAAPVGFGRARSCYETPESQERTCLSEPATRTGVGLLSSRASTAAWLVRPGRGFSR